MSIIEDEVKRQAELLEAQTMVEFFRAAPPDFAQTHGLYLEETPSYIVNLVKSPTLTIYNNVLAFGIANPASEADLEYLLELYQPSALPFSVRISPVAQPSELADWLTTRGFRLTSRSAKLYRPLGFEDLPRLASGFQIELVGPNNARDFVEISCLGLSDEIKSWLLHFIGQARWRWYVAYLQETPVATGAFYLDGEIGWLGWAATLPAYRGRGAQSALLAYRINEAARLGAKWLSVETMEDTSEKPNPSYHNLIRAGFKLAYLRPKYTYNF